MTADTSPTPATPPSPLSRLQQSRLMDLWRSGGWPCRDALEIDLLARGWVAWSVAANGHETLQLTATGIELLGQARQRQRRAAGAHDRLSQRVAHHLMGAGRIVWCELSLRAQFQPRSAGADMGPTDEPAGVSGTVPLAFDVLSESEQTEVGTARWRRARPDVFSIRNTSVEAYLQPAVHEVKVSRADLLSDLRHAAKRESYQWLCSEFTYVFPAGMAAPEEIPDELGVWVLHGDVETGRFEVLRPPRHRGCSLPFSVWMALAKASPVVPPLDQQQGHLGQPPEADR